MSTTTIQIRKISEKVHRYYQKFGYRTHATVSKTNATISATKELGLDQFKCRIAETARGTAIGFSAVNKWQNFLSFIPFIVFALLYGLNQIPAITEYISGPQTLQGINFLKLFLGTIELSIFTVIVFLVIPTIFTAINYSIQSVRLANLKARFAFFTRDANWDPNDISQSSVSLRAMQVGFYHSWLYAIIYFAILAMSQSTLSEVLSLYGINEEQLTAALLETFSISAGLIIGLISGFKALQIRRELSANDRTLRFRGNTAERRVEPVLFALQANAFIGIFSLLFLSVTFLKGANPVFFGYFFLGLIVSALVVSYIREEGALYFAIAYGAILLFSALAFVFRTGTEGALAFTIIMQILLVPFSFILIANYAATSLLEKYKIKTSEHFFQISPVSFFYTLFLVIRRRKRVRKVYTESLEEEEFPLEDTGALLLDKEVIQQKGKNALYLAKHYFELIVWYNSIFEEELVLLPKPVELLSYWEERVGVGHHDNLLTFFQFADQLVWDAAYIPDSQLLEKFEATGKEMVLALR